jgi:hypothetical protein
MIDVKTAKKKKSAAPEGDWPAHRKREAALRAVQASLARQPRAIAPAFERARLLWELGRTGEARQAYLDLLAVSPGHPGALNDLGSLLQSTGFTTAARTCHAEAVKCHPEDPTGHVKLAHLLLEDEQFPQAREHYELALRLAPDHAEAHQGFANLLAELGEEEAAREHRRLGFAGRALNVLPYRGAGAPVRVLLLVSAVRGNVPIRQFLDDRIFLVTVIVAEFYDPAAPLPAHRLIVNAIGNADICRPALEAARRLIAASPAPVINNPEAVLATGRVDVARRLGRLPDVVTPAMADVPRETLTAPEALDALAAKGFALPFLLRTPGFNNGRNFFKIESAADLAQALAALPGREITAIGFLDARGGDGKIRKYRAMLVDGRIYPLHAAIARQWKIHYVTAEMADNPEHRAEDAAFLNDMPAALGPRAMAALARIRDSLGLDYAGVDFSLSDTGEIIVFEANATMIVCPPEPGEQWDYRRAPVERVMAAVRAMLAGRAAARAATALTASPRV